MGRDGALNYLEPIETRTRGVAVLDALADMIERAGLTVGDRLPPEISLASTLGVGRSTIREALNRWEGLGIIKRRRGDGTYLAARVQTSKGLVPTMIRLEGEALLRLIEVRRALEKDVVRKATVNATPSQRAAISRLCDILIADVDARRNWHQADHAFHGAIYEASGNPMFGQILHRLDDALERSNESPFGRDDFGLDSFPPHRELADAIVAADPEAAVRAINKILDLVEADVRTIITG
ncbi:MAG: FadR family transcriptional regulator [Devosia sp.]|uniref:FadR/GntR family transcriptional regulator n=1 Tax=Devosia sp. TaxID=1871048 RepID=UPI001ACF67F5|nr:FadR/GntR family transcriptional regulator [Devosia sp.]MBN9316160.1 FadR family transcriptional regulator [Devosia sp.]